MTRALRRRALVVGGLVLLAAAVLPAAPAAADPATVRVTSPAADQKLTDPDLVVTGQVSPASHISGGVALTLALAGRTVFQDTGTPGRSGEVSFPIPPEKLASNGSYDITLKAPWEHAGLIGIAATSGTAADSISFLLAVPPARPAGVKTAVDAASRAVTVSWAKNPEPDLIRYEVKRAKGASTDFPVVGTVKAGTTSFLDTTTAEAGGDYRYVLVAVREGAPGGSDLSSDPSALSADSTAKVPDPPPPPTTAAPAGTGTGAAGAAGAGTGTASSVPANSPGALATSGSVDLSGFNTVRNQTRSVTPRTVPLPDPGFQSTLPFAPVDRGEGTLTDESGDPGELAADSPQYRELGDDTSANDRARTMAFFAAGLLATVLLMHVLWVKSEVKRVPLEALDPLGPSPGDGWAGATPGGGRRGRRKAGPAPTLDDIGAADFAPVVVSASARNAKRRSGPGGRAERAGAEATSRHKVSTGV